MTEWGPEVEGVMTMKTRRRMKVMVSSLEQKIDETEKKFEETSKLSEERLKQALDAESKITQLKTNMQRLEEKISNMELENQVLRQQSLSSSPVKSVSGVSQTPATPKLLNGNLESVNYRVDVMNPSPEQ
ncbi:hypothetical protein Droror1_Dr00001561 [Drosera rotundifolia]